MEILDHTVKTNINEDLVGHQTATIHGSLMEPSNVKIQVFLQDII